MKSNNLSKLLLCVAQFYAFISGPKMPEEKKPQLTMAFERCEGITNTKGGLVWKDIELCVEKYGHLAAEYGIYVPNKEDFKDADKNYDKKMDFMEWQRWVDEL